MKKILLTLTLALGVHQVASAGYLEGVAAYKAKNYSAAYKEFTPLAGKGHTDSQYLLGLMYYTGQGVPQDFKQAASWHLKAAGKGKADAQYILGSQYFTGQGVEQDYKQAVSWFRKAANQGHAEAQYLLGLMYMHHAAGMEKDVVLAYMLWNLAAASGSANAAEQRNALAPKMTRAQLEEGQAMSSRWKVGTPLPMESKTGTRG
ncbi:MAG TPA: tetratricopeptide repeat protein [Burkholderiaceae bacterium]